MTFCHRPLRISMPPPASSAIDSSGRDLIIAYRSPPHSKRIMFLFNTHNLKKSEVFFFFFFAHAKISAGVPPPSHTGNKQQRAIFNAMGQVSVFHPVTAYHNCPSATQHELHTNSSLHMEGKMSNWSVISDLDENVLQVLTLRTTTENRV